MMNNNLMIKGIGKKYRRLLTQVLENTKGYINAELVQKSLCVSKSIACTYLSRWARNGWIKRIKKGIYVPIELGTRDLSLPIEDPWIIAYALFSPCYLGGWTAAQYWDFTDQIFNDTVVFSCKRSRLQHQVGSHFFIVKHTSPAKMLGLHTIWKENVKILISDPHKTIVDMLHDPSIAGGIRSLFDFFQQYLRSPHKNLDLLIEYAKKMSNRTIFKRLGYLLSILGVRDENIISSCLENISQGYSQLDPSSPANKLVKKWKLWVPKNFNLESSQATAGQNL
jgi:predicted transcriptional regulator of viral defense system